MTEETNFKAICNLTTRVMGLPNGSLSFKNRIRKIQVSRSVAGYIGLTEENINRKIIAKVLDRDRAVTYHYQNNHDKNFKHCAVYREAFTKIYKEYKNIDGKKDIFINNRQMKNHLKQNRVIESDNSDVKIEVKSGKAICIIKTTYFDYSNQVENVNLAMKNYHYTIKII